MTGIKEILAVLLLAMSPIAELRGSLPLAFALGMNPLLAFCLSVLGNILPVAPVLLLLGPVSNHLRRFQVFDRFFNWLFERTRKRSELVDKYGSLGLIIFVAIPLPFTGAWTGAVLAFLLGMKFSKAFPAILVGVLIAGLAVTSLLVLGVHMLGL